MKPFCIDWYVNDWIGGTVLMSRHHKGAYMDLLMAQVNNGHMSLKQIKNLLGKEDENLWEEIICDKFKKDAEGKYYNQKIEDVVNKKKLYAESRLKNLSSHKDTHMGDHMEEEDRDKDKDVNDVLILNAGFEDFWNLYDKKVDRIKCEKKWAKLNDKDKDAIMEHLPEYILATPDKKFRRDPSTYLNNRTWDNEIIKSDGQNRQTGQGATGADVLRATAKGLGLTRGE